MSEVTYNRVNWEDTPSTNTPVNATNLNKMDKGISDCAAAVNECFQYASNGKAVIASAITGKGVPSTSADTFAQMASKIGQIKTNHTETYPTVSQNKTIDLGNEHNYRYIPVDVNKIPSLAEPSASSYLVKWEKTGFTLNTTGLCLVQILAYSNQTAVNPGQGASIEVFEIDHGTILSLKASYIFNENGKGSMEIVTMVCQSNANYCYVRVKSNYENGCGGIICTPLSV